MKIINPVFLAVLSAMACCVAGCAEVAPWERGNLAKAHMALEPYPVQSGWREHIYGSREAASGSASASGGGCGCY